MVRDESQLASLEDIAFFTKNTVDGDTYLPNARPNTHLADTQSHIGEIDANPKIELLDGGEVDTDEGVETVGSNWLACLEAPVKRRLNEPDHESDDQADYLTQNSAAAAAIGNHGFQTKPIALKSYHLRQRLLESAISQSSES